MDIDWENIECYVCCNHCDTLEFGEAPLTTTYIFAIRIHETIRLLEFDFNAGDEITLDADLLNEDSVSQITVYYLNAEDEGVIVHQCNINVSISSNVPSTCPLPDFVPDCPPCGDADYELTLDGEVVGIGTIPCSETTTIPIDGLCPISGDSTYDLNDEDGNLISSGSIVCGENGVIVAPNADIDIFDTDSNLLYALSLLSNTPNVQVINDSVATLKDTANNTLSTTNILAEGSEDIIAPDATITYNDGSALTTARSNETKDIDFVDQFANVLNPSSVVGTTVEFTLPRTLVIVFYLLAGQDYAEITITADEVGTLTAYTDDGSSGSITFTYDAVAATLPITTALTKILRIDRTTSTSDGFVRLTGTY